MDVVGSCPVCEYRLLRDEAVVASSPISLVGKIHGALAGPRGLVVMIGYSRMGGGSTQETRERSKPQKGLKVSVHRRDVEIVCNYEIHGRGGGREASQSGE